MIKNKLNTLFNNIGDNAVNNENTSLDIIKEYLNLHHDNKLKVNNGSIYLLLSAKNNAGIKATIKGITKLNELTELRKKVVNSLLLPMANLSKLVENENENETKVEKIKKKKENQAKPESDFAVKKSDESIKNNTIRTTANNITYPLLFLISQDKSNYKFENGKLYINIMAIAKNVVQSVFGFNKDGIKLPENTPYLMAVNLTMLIKLAKADLFAVEITKTIENENENENVAVATDESVSGDFTESKEKQLVKSVITFLNYLDKNKAFNSLLEIENHIFTLENYGHRKNDITEQVRKQSNNKNNYDLYGSVAVEFNHSKTFETNNFDELESQFRKTFAIK